MTGLQNQKEIKFLKDKLNVSVGFSDHTLGNTASVIAIGLGASIIEKHFTLDKAFDGPDHSASLSISELELMIKKIHQLQLVLSLHQMSSRKITYIKKI